MKNFFSEIDSRIFSFDFSKIFDSKYLFETNPGEFTFQNWFILVGILGLVVSLFLIRYTKRPKKRLDKNRRFVVRDFAKMNLLLVGIWIMLIAIRSFGFQYLSMRALLLLIGILLIANLGNLMLRYNKKQIKIKKKKVTSGEYSSYLPKKKKKK